MNRMYVFLLVVSFILCCSSCNNTNAQIQSDVAVSTTTTSMVNNHFENSGYQLVMPEYIMISECYDGEMIVIKPKSTDSILFQTGDADAVIVELSDKQIEHLNHTYESITDFSSSSEMTSTSTVTVKAHDQVYSFGLGCASQSKLNEYIECLLSLNE